MRHPSKTPKLAELAMGCDQGACNVVALLKALAEALPELEPFEAQHHPAVRYIIAHLAFLLGEHGPSWQAAEGYVAWRDQPLLACNSQ